MKMGSRMTPCCLESGSAWVRRGHSAGLPSRKLVLSTSRKGSVRTVCHTHDAHRSLRARAEQVPRRSATDSPLCPPTSFIDPARMRREGKLQAQVKSSPEVGGREFQNPVSATGSERETQPSPHLWEPHAQGPMPACGEKHCACQRERVQRCAQPLRHCRTPPESRKRAFSRRWTSSREHGPCGAAGGPGSTHRPPSGNSNRYLGPHLAEHVDQGMPLTWFHFPRWGRTGRG